MKANNLRKKSIQELKQELHSLLQEQFKLRMQKTNTESIKPHLYKQVRKNIARVKTVMQEKQMNESGE